MSGRERIGIGGRFMQEYAPLLAIANDNKDKLNCSRSLRLGTDSKDKVIVP